METKKRSVGARITRQLIYVAILVFVIAMLFGFRPWHYINFSDLGCSSQNRGSHSSPQGVLQMYTYGFNTQNYEVFEQSLWGQWYFASRRNDFNATFEQIDQVRFTFSNFARTELIAGYIVYVWFDWRLEVARAGRRLEIIASGSTDDIMFVLIEGQWHIHWEHGIRNLFNHKRSIIR